MSLFITPALFMRQPSGLQGALYRGDHLKPTQGSPGIYSHAGWPFTSVVFVPQSVQDLTWKGKGGCFHITRTNQVGQKRELLPQVTCISLTFVMNSFIQALGNHQARNGCAVVVLFVCLFYCPLGSFKGMYPSVNKDNPPPIRDLINWMDGQ